MITQDLTFNFDFSVQIATLRQEIEAIFEGTDVFFNWDFGKRDFQALVSTEEEPPALELRYRKLTIYLRGQKIENALKDLSVEVEFHGITTNNPRPELKRFEELLTERIHHAEEKSGPVIEVLTPKKDAILKDKRKVKGKVKRMDVKTVEAFLDDELVFEGASKDIEFTLDTTKHRDGDRELSLVVKNTDGKEIRRQIPIKIYNHPPKLIVKGVKNGDIATKTETIGLHSKGGEIAEIDITIDGEELYSEELEAPRKKVKKAYHWNTSEFKDGWHDVKFTINTQERREASKVKHILTINPPEGEQPHRPTMPFNKSKFFKEVLETVKTLIAPHYGGILSINEVTRIMNKIFNYERRITTKEITKAVHQAEEGKVRWISHNHLIEFVPVRKVADGWLKRRIVKFARTQGKRGFNTDEAISHIDAKGKTEKKDKTACHMDERGKRCLEDLKREGVIIRQKYPPRWYFSGKSNKARKENNSEERKG